MAMADAEKEECIIRLIFNIFWIRSMFILNNHNWINNFSFFYSWKLLQREMSPIINFNSSISIIGDPFCAPRRWILYERINLLFTSCWSYLSYKRENKLASSREPFLLVLSSIHNEYFQIWSKLTSDNLNRSLWICIWSINGSVVDFPVINRPQSLIGMLMSCNRHIYSIFIEEILKTCWY